jgi:hypothetical protein
MKAVADIRQVAAVSSENPGLAVDTTFVLFFLALDFSQRAGIGIEAVLSILTLIIFVVLPYFLPYDGAKPNFGQWVAGRVAVAVLGTVIGVVFGQAVGVFLPETFRFVPLTLLIIAGLISCYLRFYGLLRFRLAK